MSGKVRVNVVDNGSFRGYIRRDHRRRPFMKQPELGRKISELRKGKGLTQEELVEKCNISVRTLQRIEIGEVTPRSYTVRTILAALDYDLTAVTLDDDVDAAASRGILRQHILLEVDEHTSPEFLKTLLGVAWIAGILYFLLGFFEGAADIARFQEEKLVFSQPIYVGLKISILVAFVLFQRGFVIMGGIFNNYLLRIMSFLLILGEIVTVGYDIASVFYDSPERGWVLGAEAFTYGGILIAYGVSLIWLRASVGTIAQWAGIFNIVAGCFFLSIVLAFIGFFILMPAELLQIIILYKGIDVIRLRQAAERSSP
jgi:transcriptional regulator with XRE-family HTH domain